MEEDDFRGRCTPSQAAAPARLVQETCLFPRSKRPEHGQQFGALTTPIEMSAALPVCFNAKQV